MNTIKDFHKKETGVVINVNTKDFKRARNRNFTRREVEKQIGDGGEVAQLKSQVEQLQALVEQLLSGSNE